LAARAGDDTAGDCAARAMAERGLAGAMISYGRYDT